MINGNKKHAEGTRSKILMSQLSSDLYSWKKSKRIAPTTSQKKINIRHVYMP